MYDLPQNMIKQIWFILMILLTKQCKYNLQWMFLHWTISLSTTATNQQTSIALTS